MVGPTASGKTDLALGLAKALNAEIVSADSRLVYRGMDIGTAKPSLEQRATVPHHLIDVVDPGEQYDAARYRDQALAAIGEIQSRSRVAIIVGGTGLYLRAVLDGLELDAVPRDPALRAELEALSLLDGGALVLERLRQLDPEAAAIVPKGNVRRLVRYLEIATLRGSVAAAQRRGKPIDSLRIGLNPPRTELDRRIDARALAMVHAGVLDETRLLLRMGLPSTTPALTAHGYKHWARHLSGEIELPEAVALTANDTRAYARRQMTWFRRDSEIQWLDPLAADPLAAALDLVRESHDG